MRGMFLIRSKWWSGEGEKNNSCLIRVTLCMRDGRVRVSAEKYLAMFIEEEREKPRVSK